MVDEANLDDMLTRLHTGNREAAAEFLALVYGQLKALARGQLNGHTGSLDSTGLVNEAYLKLFRGAHQWESRAHFLATAARAMRQILVDHARKRGAAKRACRGERVALDELVEGYARRGADLVALDEALERLSARDPQLVQIVEMRFFGNYSIAETSRVLEMSPSSVSRGWQIAKAFLARELNDG